MIFFRFHIKPIVFIILAALIYPSITNSKTTVPGVEISQPIRTSQIILNNGYVIEFNRPVILGWYTAAGPKVPYVNTEGLPVSVTSVSHPLLSPSEIIITYSPDQNMENGQPYDASESGSYNATLRLHPPFERAPSATPTTLQLTKFEPARKALNTYPYLNISLSSILIFVNTTPPRDALVPPNVGPATLKQSSFNASEILANLYRWKPKFQIPSTTPSLSDLMPELCRGPFQLSGFSNLSGGRRYVFNPIGAPSETGDYPSTYGAFRAQKIADYMMAILNPAEPLSARQKAALCFTQNIAATLAGYTLGGYASNESGGQGGGMLAASFFASILLPSNKVLREGLKQAVLNHRFSESNFIFQSPSKQTAHYGSPPFSQNDFYRCVVGSYFHWARGDFTYCSIRPGDSELQTFDPGIGDAYQVIGTAMYLVTAFFQLQVPEFRKLVNYEPILQYTERYLKQGTQCYDPEVEGALRNKLIAAIEEHNAAATQNHWPLIPVSTAQEKIDFIRSRQGYYGMSHHNANVYQWLLDYYQVNR